MVKTKKRIKRVRIIPREIKGTYSQTKGLIFYMKIINAVYAEKKCERCGNCCDCFIISLNKNDLERCPELTENSEPITNKLKNYLIEKSPYCPKGFFDEAVRILNTKENSKTCVYFSKEKGCTIHNNKPHICKDFPATLWQCKRAEISKNTKIEIETLAYSLINSEFDNPDLTLDKNHYFRGIFILLPFLWSFISFNKKIVMTLLDEDEIIPQFFFDIFCLEKKLKYIKELPFFQDLQKMNTFYQKERLLYIQEILNREKLDDVGKEIAEKITKMLKY